MADATTPHLPIRTVAAETGVNAVTLRAWERRYGLIKPQRTESGHRLYSQAEVDRIRRIVELLDQGVSVGQVSTVLESTMLTRQMRDDGSHWRQLGESMIEAIRQFDERELTRLYGDAMAAYPVDLVNRMLLIPTLEELGDRWASGAGSIAEEHFFQVFVRDKLGARIHHHARRNTGPALVVACMPGELHDLGLLFFVVQALDRGLRVINLGADLPLDEIPYVVKQCTCAAVVLVANYGVADKVFAEDLPDLLANLEVPVMVGGHQAAGHRTEIHAAGAVFLGDSLQEGIHLLAATLERRPAGRRQN